MGILHRDLLDHGVTCCSSTTLTTLGARQSGWKTAAEVGWQAHRTVSTFLSPGRPGTSPRQLTSIMVLTSLFPAATIPLRRPTFYGKTTMALWRFGRAPAVTPIRSRPALSNKQICRTPARVGT